MDCSFFVLVYLFYYDYTTEVFWIALDSGSGVDPV